MKHPVKYLSNAVGAFTILEMVVSILLTLILFSMLYLSYSVIQRQVDKGSRDLSDILYTGLCTDIRMWEAEAITFDQPRVIFQSPLKVTYMLFESGCILLESGGSQDTLYKGNYTCQVHVDPGLQLVDQIDLQFISEKDTFRILSGKRYLPAVLLNRKEVDFDY